MRNRRGIVNNRHQNILERLEKDTSVFVSDLSEELEVSAITIRRDLQYLEEQGLVIRFHGGATLVKETLVDSPGLLENKTINKEKEIIAKYAASLIEEDDIIFINSSSTALLILDYIGDKRVQVITNNGKALIAKLNSNIDLIFTGGEVTPQKYSMVGDFAQQAISRVVADKAFIGVSGISVDHGVTTSLLEETAINKLMMSRCGNQCYVVADHTKIGQKNNFLSSSIHYVNTLITDSNANQTELNDIRRVGVEVTVLEA